MIFEPFVWDVVLIFIAAYAAIVSLVRMMRSYRQQLILQMRTLVLEKRAASRAKAKPRSVSDE